MKCPKCRHEQHDRNIECVKCGVIFAKFAAAQRQGRPREKSDPPQEEKRSGLFIGEVLFYTPADNNMLFIIGRGVVFIGLIIWGIRFIASPLEDNYASASLMHLVNLPFHEAGHIFFRFLGSFMTSLGGTIGQFLMPLICLGVFLLKTRDPFGASVALWWFGQNFFDIAPYVNDARSLSLPLLGGNTGHSAPYGFHDWQYLLTESGLLPYDHIIAKSCVIAGTLTFAAAFAWGAVLLYKQYQNR